MITTRKEKRDTGKIEEYIRDMFQSTIRSLTSDTITFLDELYRLIDARLTTMQSIGSINIPLLDQETPVESDFYTHLAESVKDISELNLMILPDVYSMLSEIADDVMSAGEKISESIITCEQLLNKTEGTIKRKMSLSSIKDEVIIYDSILNDEYIDSGTLSIDYRGGSIMLGIESYDRVWYEIKDISFSKPKGSISRPLDSTHSLDFITDGYFNTRVFSANPVFENKLDSQTTAINDGNIQTSYIVEYNTKTPVEHFSMSLQLAINSKKAAQFGTRRVDQILIYLDPGERNSMISRETITPFLSRLSVNDKDKTSEIRDNTINIRGARIGEHERGFQTRPSAIYPTGAFMICSHDVEQITIDIIADTPQQIWYPEKIVKNDTGNCIHTFNYFETLILNNYEPPGGHPDPRDLYTKREINDMYSILNSGHSQYDNHIPLYRYCIGIKDIELFTFTYQTNGFLITKNLNYHENKKIAAVDMYVNEIIPEGTTITYYISHDKVVWHEINPLSRGDSETCATRIVYNGIETKTGDTYINVTSKEVYVKIIMHGSYDHTPLLKSYAVRIKYQ